IPGFGTVSLDIFSPAFGLLLSGVLPPSGSLTLTAAIPNDPALLAGVLFMQGIVTDPAHSPPIALTRALRIDFESPDSFTPLPDLAGPRALAPADLLPDGRALITGGGTGSLTSPNGANSTQIYQPFSRTWSSGPPMSIARGFHASATLADGRVL